MVIFTVTLFILPRPGRGNEADFRGSIKGRRGIFKRRRLQKFKAKWERKKRKGNLKNKK